MGSGEGDIHNTVYKIPKQQGPLYNTGNYIQHPIMNCDGKEYEQIYVCVCVCVCVYITESLCCIPETQHCEPTVFPFLK